MVTDQEILDYIFSKWGKKEEMRQLNEQYHIPPISTLHLEDFIPDMCPKHCTRKVKLYLKSIGQSY